MIQQKAQLEIDSISKSFGGIAALCGLSFNVQGGRVLGMIGGNGAGKTTAVNVITGWYAPDKGDIRLNGRSVRGESSEALGRRGICRSWQSPELPSALTVTEYLSLGHDFGRHEYILPNLLWPSSARRHRNVARQAALAALERFGLLSLADRNCRQLSGGERKFISLLRVFLRRPQVLFLDEPTTALNQRLILSIEELCREFVAVGGALAVISHSVGFIEGLADDLVLIKEGRAEVVTKVAESNWRTMEPIAKRRSTSALETSISTEQLEIRSNGAPLLSDVTFAVKRGELTGVIGPNGAGKSTLLKTIHSLLPRSSGSIKFAGVEITRRPPHEISQLGLGFCLQGARVPPRLTVASALKMAANSINSNAGKHIKQHRASIWSDSGPMKDTLERFPNLARRSSIRAGLLSGGEQQLLAIAMQFCRRPIALLLDEPSVGLHDSSLQQVLGWIDELADRGLSGILVEQDTDALFSVVDSVLKIADGKITAFSRTQVQSGQAS